MAVEKLIVDHIDTWTTALQTRSTAGRGSSGKIDLYGIKKLRELILELAVRGKLVPQDPNDEPASELLKRIAAEKAELVKQGKIKKPKPLPEISEEEKPFELPEGWEWARINDIASFTNGYAFKSSEFQDSGVGIVKIGDIDSSGFISIGGMSYVSEKNINVLPEEMRVNPGDMVIAMSGATTGKLGFNKTKNTFLLNQRVGKIAPYSVDKEFIYHYLSTRIEANLSISLGSAIPNISTAQINSIIIPIPPSNEQIKITARVKSLISICNQLVQSSLASLDAHQQLVETLLTTLTDSQNADELAENWARISEHFDTLFTTEASIDALKQTILQLSVMGKLVPQDPNDEPASELLKRIAQEKAQLVKDGKMKKQKPLPPISDEEKPFELPSGWEWCRLGSIFNFLNGYAFKSEWFSPAGLRLLRNANIAHGVTNWKDVVHIPNEMIDNFENYVLSENDIVISLDRPIINTGLKYAIISESDLPCLLLQRVAKFKNYANTVSNTFLTTWLKSYFFINSIDPGRSNGVPHISTKQLEMTLFPLLSQSEQDRIISKANELISICEKLKYHIQTSQQTQLHLADALTDAAIN
ncbi:MULTISPECIES: restriction endonuclease subunit S [Klebsiella]|uniref:Restriction endonuclease subunit S n=1 Tax=Klebsiella pasteurii TaxID=2587529 RepID=A0ABD5HDR9_9ENTR|nr:MULTISPECIES: restriction endonuclease subunit S [Klebsiella]OVU35413.1 restriction endonuclease [Klebsiella michiganensis]MDM4221500.1 restriction endonuclease subunit S [Klebsiella pasteurii]MDW2716666.1 restriction endonuclease subunit S [Klebsiella pasteurii]MDX7160860.1 restriction endonuclease subunit S [Klebsiella pasteurii]VUS76067.1 Type-1 restriction enzyme EcoKI specificity protein [Klebsiella pasteurii]